MPSMVVPFTVGTEDGLLDGAVVVVVLDVAPVVEGVAEGTKEWEGALLAILVGVILGEPDGIDGEPDGIDDAVGPALVSRTSRP